MVFGLLISLSPGIQNSLVCVVTKWFWTYRTVVALALAWYLIIKLIFFPSLKILSVFIKFKSSRADCRLKWNLLKWHWCSFYLMYWHTHRSVLLYLFAFSLVASPALRLWGHSSGQRWPFRPLETRTKNEPASPKTDKYLHLRLFLMYLSHVWTLEYQSVVKCVCLTSYCWS